MSVRRALLVRWSRRARLPVLTVTVLGGATPAPRRRDDRATDDTRGGLDG